MKVHKILQSDAFGPSNPSVVAEYEEDCRKLYPLASPFRIQAKKAVSGSGEGPAGVPVAQVKDVAAKTITASGSGLVVLKETSLSSAAMSDLSGDINDTKAGHASSPDNNKHDITNMVNNSSSVEVGAN